jgi:hypothetical protein
VFHSVYFLHAFLGVVQICVAHRLPRCRNSQKHLSFKTFLDVRNGDDDGFCTQAQRLAQVEHVAGDFKARLVVVGKNERLGLQ